MDKRYHRVKWGKGQPRQRTSMSNWFQPIKWHNLQVESGAAHHGAERPRVFCASLADWLDEEVPIEWLADLLSLIHQTPNLDWLLLTKRPENFFERIKGALWNAEGLAEDDEGDSEDLPATDTGHMLNNWIGGEPPANVWIGATVEDQARADERIPLLLNIPAKVRFLSCEPLLEAVDLTAIPFNKPETENDPQMLVNALSGLVTGIDEYHEQIHWLICGGESGPGKRPFNPDWARWMRDQCKAAGVPFFMKQMDKVIPIPADLEIKEFPV